MAAAAIPDGIGTRRRLETLIQLFRLAFGRAADPDGLQSFFAYMQGGATPQQVAAHFVESQEFLEKHPEGPRDSLDLVEELYGAAFGLDAAREVLMQHGAALSPIAGLGAKIAVLAELAPRPSTAGTIAFTPNDPAGYRVWIAWNEPEDQADQGVDDAAQPLISIIVPVDGNCPRLRAAIRSVLSQSYQNWELLLVGWPSPDAWLTILGSLWRDKRLRLVTGIPGQSTDAKLQAALRKARGAIVGVLGAADALHPTCLAKVAGGLRSSPGTALVYADEDVLRPDGGRSSPWFKHDWDQDAATALDQIGRCWFVSASRLRAAMSAGAIDPSNLAEGLALKLSRTLHPNEIAHIPAVLYHRFDPATDQESTKAGGSNGTESRDLASLAPARWPTVSIIVPTRDRANLLQVCLTGVLEHTDYPSIEVIVANNDSREADTLALLSRLREDHRVRVVDFPGPFNWGAINNLAVASATGEVLVLLNNDIEIIEPDWLRELVIQVVRPEVGIVGATLLYPDRTIQHAGMAFSPDGTSGHIGRHLTADAPGPGGRFRVVRQTSAVTGACLAIRRDVYQALGGVEDEGLMVTWSDTDLCLKAWSAGYSVLVTPFARLIHLELATRGSDAVPEAAARFETERSWMRRRWGARLCWDPFFSHHLDAETGELRLLNTDASQAAI